MHFQIFIQNKMSSVEISNKGIKYTFLGSSNPIQTNRQIASSPNEYMDLTMHASKPRYIPLIPNDM
jgi:hypothetical protein